MPALIEVLAQRDPRGCFEALAAMELQNRGNSQCWQTLLVCWLPQEPAAALEAILNHPSLDGRHGAGEGALQALEKTHPDLYTRLLEERGDEIFVAGMDDLNWPDGRPVDTRIKRSSNVQSPRSSEAMSNLTPGSPAARRYVLTAAPGRLNAHDFRRAMGEEEDGPVGLAWLAAQTHPAALLALLDQPEAILKHPQLSGDPFLRSAAIRRLAMKHAAAYNQHGLDEWVKSLTSEEREIAAETVRMDTTLPPETQNSALRVLTTDE